MAWNYEKGCEEEMPYKYGSGLYTPPDYSSRPEILSVVLNWEKAEARVYCMRAMNRSPSYISWNDTARHAWRRLEEQMIGDTWDNNAKIPEFRRKYIEWLAKEVKIASDIGLCDPVSEESLPMLERIIAAGYRTLAKTAHPDLGGTDKDFRNLKIAKEQLDSMLAEVKDIL